MSISYDPAAALKNGDSITANNGASYRVVHFDATMVRREKMRTKALGKTGRETPLTTSSIAVAATVARESTPTSSAPAALNGQSIEQFPHGSPLGPSTTSTSLPDSPLLPATNTVPDELENESLEAKKSAPPPEQLETFLINFVVEQTGYPAEIVELDVDLEADLGIDSIKKAQLFGELREYFEIMPTEDMTLDDFSTLRHVVDFLRSSPTESKQPEPIQPGTPVDQETDRGIPDDPPASAVVELNSQASPSITTGPASSGAASSTVKSHSKAPASDQLEPFLINFVVEQTGYPAEIVEMDADLEADLGIDSIKKAQLFGELREYFDITPTEDLTLDDFSTLRDVMEFLQGTHTKQTASGNSLAETGPVQANSAHVSPTAAPSSATVTSPAGIFEEAPAPDQLEPFLINFVVEQTGYPAEIIEMDADLEADLGIDSIKKAQLFGELREYFDITPTEDLALDDFPTLRDVMNFLQGSHPKQSQQPQPSAVPSSATMTQSALPVAPAAQTNSDTAPAASTGQTVRPSKQVPPPEQLEAFLVNFVVEQTGYPPEIVEMDADLEADLGIDSIKKAQLFGELREYFEITPTDDLALDDFLTLRDVMKFLQGSHPKSKSASDATVTSTPTSSLPDPAANRNGNSSPAADESFIMQAMNRIIIDRNMADVAKANLTSSTRLIDDVGLDSVGMLDLITAVEKQFDITISLEDLEIESLNEAGAFVSLVGRKLAEKV